MFLSTRALKAQLALRFFENAELTNPAMLGLRSVQDSAPSRDMASTLGPAARASSAGAVRGPMIIGLVFLMIIEFMIQFGLILFFGWLLMKVLDFAFLYFAVGVVAFFFALSWFWSYPMMVRLVNHAKENQFGSGLNKTERGSLFRQAIVGYIINLAITILALLLVARVLGVSVSLPNGGEIPAISSLDSTQLVTGLALTFIVRIIDQIVGSGARAAQTAYASVAN